MKRTGPLKRKTPIQNRSELKAKAPMNRKREKRSAPRRQAANDNRWRSEVYLAWVRTLPCSVCGATGGVAAHHLVGMYGLSGMGLKAPDSFVMPACDPIYGHVRDCHQQIHSNKALRDRQPAFLRDTLSRAVRAFDGETKAELVKAWRIIEEKEEAA
ncbi:DUF968 domain-containing protein [Halomonas koreensis]|uniref:DUF968 domain-containing protein n=1 Tax=Halomonas koreensis TaxID=245385 RepID=A0ABU1G4Q2_9GAMM|nr:DUF968 domain-containing protein [Halomonas koreensis]MDR5867944.1 DUF968 domain-containing protein [Halomonas koreensis]